MAAQYDVYRLRDGALVVVIQGDLLDQLQTRVVAPLVPAGKVKRVLRSLNPTVSLGEETYLIMPQLAATLTLAELGERIGSLSMMRDQITRAVDALLSGV
ncbi:MAG: CcdB family protein [Roseovarius sp.]|uniref:CcdB family protein n=1 Tax=Roseovarius sp. TaxID=1486281 RepID=UPI0032EFF68D